MNIFDYLRQQAEAIRKDQGGWQGKPVRIPKWERDKISKADLFIMTYYKEDDHTKNG